jgi:hypothetical protein
MSRFTGYTECPKCVEQGRDRARDNLGNYSDGSAHCFSCGHHVFPRTPTPRKEIENGTEDKITLPRDFTREVPAKAWRWLLQYGLPYSYWKKSVGYSPKDERLVFTVGEPVQFSIGRFIGDRGNDAGEGTRKPRKWFFWGDGHGYVEVLGNDKKGAVVLVEDLISAHKVAQVAPAICLFGTNIHTKAIQALLPLKRPVTLWLDADQRTLLPKKINRLQAFLTHPVGFVSTEKDPKAYSLDEIQEILK